SRSQREDSPERNDSAVDGRSCGQRADRRCVVEGGRRCEVQHHSRNDRADVSCTTRVGTTALMFSAASGNVDAVQALIKAGADVNATDKTQGQTAAIFAAANGRADVIRILAANKADLNARSNVPTRLSKTVGQSFTPV